jgi:small subunit ribosomal protein S7
MARRKRPSHDHLLKPDPVYNSLMIGKFINKIMFDGKKTIAQKIFYKALKLIKKKIPDKDPVDVFKQAVENCKPKLEVKSRRVGGATYQVPFAVNPKRQVNLAMKWIIQSARAKKGRPMFEKLADEIASAYFGTGDAIKKRDELHKIAEANRAFAHLAW